MSPPAPRRASTTHQPVPINHADAQVLPLQQIRAASPSLQTPPSGNTPFLSQDRLPQEYVWTQEACVSSQKEGQQLTLEEGMAFVVAANLRSCPAPLASGAERLMGQLRRGRLGALVALPGGVRAYPYPRACAGMAASPVGLPEQPGEAPARPAGVAQVTAPTSKYRSLYWLNRHLHANHGGGPLH